jgi:hypothetical protein
VSGQLHAPATLPPGKELPVPIGYEIGWTPVPVWTTWRTENSWFYRDSNSDPSIIQPVTSRYTDYAIPTLGKRKYSEKTCPSATLSITNPTWDNLVSNPGRRGGKPATNRLNYGTVITILVKLLCSIFNTLLEFLRRWGIQTYGEFFLRMVAHTRVWRTQAHWVNSLCLLNTILFLVTLVRLSITNELQWTLQELNRA